MLHNVLFLKFIFIYTYMQKSGYKHCWVYCFVHSKRFRIKLTHIWRVWCDSCYIGNWLHTYAILWTAAWFFWTCANRTVHIFFAVVLCARRIQLNCGLCGMAALHCTARRQSNRTEMFMATRIHGINNWTCLNFSRSNLYI